MRSKVQENQAATQPLWQKLELYVAYSWSPSKRCYLRDSAVNIDHWAILILVLNPSFQHVGFISHPSVLKTQRCIDLMYICRVVHGNHRAILKQMQLACSVFPPWHMLLATLAPLCPPTLFLDARSSVLGQRNRWGWNATNIDQPKKHDQTEDLNWMQHDAIWCSPNLLERLGHGFLCTESKSTLKWGDMKTLEADHSKCLNWYDSSKAMRPLDHQILTKDDESIHHRQASMIKMEDGQVWLWCGESGSFIFGSPVAMCLCCSWIQKNRSWRRSV